MFKFRDARAQLIEERKKNAELQEKNVQLEQYVNDQADALIELAAIIEEMEEQNNG